METTPDVVRSDDPRRCLAVSGTRQCGRMAADGYDYCDFHNSGQRLKLKKDNERQYLLNNWRAEIDHFSNHAQVKSLREEIGILRLLMQTVLNRCQDADDLMIHTPRIMELTQNIKGIIQTCHTMEEKTQFLVDKNQIIHLAEQILIIISEFVADPNVLSAIADRIRMAIESKSTVTVTPEGEVVDATRHQS